MNLILLRDGNGNAKEDLEQEWFHPNETPNVAAHSAAQGEMGSPRLREITDVNLIAFRSPNNPLAPAVIKS